MKQEDKDLLLKDLCARVGYGLKFAFGGNIYIMKGIDLIVTDEGVWEYAVTAKGIDPIEIEYIKPYLRPLSSMTEEECKELGELPATIENVGETLPNAPYYIEVARPEQIDWLNTHHFDYRGLIPMGLALEAPDGMYKIE